MTTRGLTRRWMLPAPVETAPQLSRLDLPPLVGRILTARGQVDPDEVQRFCDPRLTDLHDPSLLPGVEEAAHRLVDAVRNDRLIAIYGDYDVDGVTATAILFHTIRAAAPEARLITYVPHRVDEGYGLNHEALRALRERGADVAITVDCGITAQAEAQTARDIGLELIITDHHNLPEGGDLPDALLVHPRLPGAGSTYPFGDLCGAGVAYKLAWRFATCWCDAPRVNEALQQTLITMLPLAALGTIADVVPLVGENRILASWGLHFIKQTPLPGLRALIAASGLDGEDIDSERVGFALGPRLNACGRMGHAEEAVKLFTDATAEEAVQIARSLSQLNRKRQKTERDITTQAAALAEDAGMTGPDRRVIILADPDWHPGVVGIVCSRLVDRFARPTILLQNQGDLCKGSARSVEGYSIHDGLLATREHLESFGGHEMAAGLTLKTENLPAFVEAFTAHANAHITPDQLVASIRVDCDGELGEINMPVVKQIQQLAPFGRANRTPTVRIRAATIAEAPKQIGSGGRHLSVRFRSESDGRRCVLRGVWWNAGGQADKLAAGMQVDVAIEPKLGSWNGRQTVDAVIRDVMICG